MSIEILETEPLSTKLDESEGRLFYVLFTYLQTKAYELLNSCTRSQFPLWNHLNPQQNPMELRNLVSRKVFDDFEVFYRELGNMPASDKRMLKAISQAILTPLNKLSESNLQLIHAWQNTRVEGEFWFIGCCKDGGLFAYLGDNENEEKVFVVKALATPFSQLLKLTHTSVCPTPFINTVLLPWKDCIIYHGIMTPCLGYPPKELIEKHDRLTDIVPRCERNGRIRKILTSDDSILVQRLQIGYEGEKFSNFMMEPKRITTARMTTNTTTEINIGYIIWSPFLDTAKRCTPEELKAILTLGNTEGYKNTITYSQYLYPGDKCRLCISGIFGICECKKKHDLLASNTDGPFIYCLDGITCQEETTNRQIDGYVYDINKMKLSLMDFYTFVFKVSHKDFLEIQFRLKECNLFFSAHNITNEKSAFFHHIGPILLNYQRESPCILTFGSIEMFYKDNRIEINNNSLSRAMNMVNILRFIILGDNDYGNGHTINVTDMLIEVNIYSSMKNKSQVKYNASELASKLEEFIHGKVSILIDKNHFDYRSCSYCGKKNSPDQKLKACSLCKDSGTMRKALYCSTECQKKHWKFHKETAGH